MEIEQLKQKRNKMLRDKRLRDKLADSSQEDQNVVKSILATKTYSSEQKRIATTLIVKPDKKGIKDASLKKCIDDFKERLKSGG